VGGVGTERRADLVDSLVGVGDLLDDVLGGLGGCEQLHLPAGENAVRLPSRLIISAAWRLLLSAVGHQLLSILRWLALVPRRTMEGI
jgi:hypothetical protein